MPLEDIFTPETNDNRENRIQEEQSLITQLQFFGNLPLLKKLNIEVNNLDTSPEFLHIIIANCKNVEEIIFSVKRQPFGAGSYYHRFFWELLSRFGWSISLIFIFMREMLKRGKYENLSQNSV